ncbi:MAG: rRNA maturation RNase YbeY [Synechococcales bacterium]|nr:rRNA maturation RNase YbeY [Synechococcales bacterium]
MRPQNAATIPLQVEVNVQYGEMDGADSHELGKDGEAIAPAGIPPESWQQWFHRWLEVINPALSPIHAYELSLCLTSDEGIRALNAQYRNLEQPTDVLAFAALEGNFPATDEADEYPLYLGDIVISTETAQRQAQERGHSYRWELAWLAAHGLLHLLGWDHPDEASLERMLNQQDHLLSQIGEGWRFDLPAIAPDT